MVTREFRSWDQSMEVPKWQLKKTGEIWLITFDNGGNSVIRPNTKFKFRIDDGEWL